MIPYLHELFSRTSYLFDRMAVKYTDPSIAMEWSANAGPKISFANIHLFSKMQRLCYRYCVFIISLNRNLWQMTHTWKILRYVGLGTLSNAIIGPMIRAVGVVVRGQIYCEEGPSSK